MKDCKFRNMYDPQRQGTVSFKTTGPGPEPSSFFKLSSNFMILLSAEARGFDASLYFSQLVKAYSIYINWALNKTHSPSG